MDRDKGLRVFFSYSHRDQRYLHELQKHLANLREEGLISLWHDRAIRPGEDWEKRIRDQLERADVILLLISSDFNDSDFCRREEMARAIQRHQQGKAKVIPVVVRHVEALPAEVAHIQAIPADLKPITSFKPQNERNWRSAANCLKKRSVALNGSPTATRWICGSSPTTNTCCVYPGPAEPPGYLPDS